MEINAIYCGDIKEILFNNIPNESVDLCYVDPPFFSNKTYEIIWENGYEKRSFEDRWRGGVQNYIAWMEPKIREVHRVLKNTGSFYLHCDHHASHHLKIMLDRIFSKDNFRNEIIWFYGGTTRDKYRFAPKHDTILFYSKEYKSIRFNADDVRIPYKHGYEGYKQDKEGKWYKFWSKKKGNYYPPQKKINGKWKLLGKYQYDVWTDIPSMATAHGKEYLGYPTQKPEALLERIIKASSNPTDIVLDPMCGCGTTLAVAHKLGRRWIGIDVSPTACRLMAKRMRGLGVDYPDNKIINLPRTLEEIKAMEPFEFQNWACQRLYAKMSRRVIADGGIDGHLVNKERTPVQIKRSERIGRNVIDNFKSAIQRESSSRGVDIKEGIIVALSFGRGAQEEVARLKIEEGYDIKLITAKELVREGNE